MGEGEDEGEKSVLRSRFGFLNYASKRYSGIPPHLNPLPPGERKEKDEILTRESTAQDGGIIKNFVGA
jgi:hypothetical protein